MVPLPLILLIIAPRDPHEIVHLRHLWPIRELIRLLNHERVVQQDFIYRIFFLLPFAASLRRVNSLDLITILLLFFLEGTLLPCDKTSLLGAEFYLLHFFRSCITCAFYSKIGFSGI